MSISRSAPKDRRLYAKFDIGMDEHAKIIVLSDPAFRALFESTLYSRRQLTDGFLDERVVLRKWGADVAAELSSNDPARPSWIKVDGGWRIHDFAEHQTTNEDIEKKREAGRSGGLAKAKQNASKPVAPASEVPEHLPSNRLAKTETETETETSLKDLSGKPNEFDLWYAAYPRKDSRGAAEKAFPKALKAVGLEALIAGATRYRNDPNREEGFTKMPATWLNGKCWADGPLPAKSGSSKQTTSDKMRDTFARGQALQARLDNAANQTILEIGA